MRNLQSFTLLFLLVLTSAINTSTAQCEISLSRDLNISPPLILKPTDWPPYGTHPYYLPERSDGIIRLPPDAELHLFCPGGAIHHNDGVDASGMLHVRCDERRSFSVLPTNIRVPFSRIECAPAARHSVRRTQRTCMGSRFEELEIGFALNDGRWLTQITVCFDGRQRRTLYTHFNLSTSIHSAQSNVPRIYFEEGGSFFNLDVPVEQCYYIPQQRRIINRQLNLPAEDVSVIDKGHTVFTRGHLVAKADFVYGPQQGATFYFVNAAPQWMQLNNWNWNELEMSVRAFAGRQRKSGGADLEVYTGTLGLARVGNVDLFLHCDSENHLPVPQYYWKVVYDAAKHAGVAFVGVNNPFELSFERAVFCEDVCERLTWSVTWRRRQQEFGFGFCCEVDALRNFAQFPQLDVEELLV